MALSETQTIAEGGRPRWLWLVPAVLVGPALLVVLLLYPALDLRLQSAVGHFWIVGIPALIAILLALVIFRAALVRRDGRMLLISQSFLALSTIFLVHAVGTPSVLFDDTLIATQWSTPMALLVGSIFLTASASEQFARQRWLVGRWAWVIGGVGVFLLAYAAFMLWFVPHRHALGGAEAPTVQTRMSSFAERSFPIITWLTVGLYSVTAYIYGRRWWRAPTRPLAALICGAIFLAQTALAAQYGQLWQLSFWLYHVLLFAAIGVIAYATLGNYERTGSLSSVAEGMLLGTTLERQRAAFQEGLAALLTTLEHGDVRAVAALRGELRQRFALADDQLDLLNHAVEVIAQDREQGRRLQALADIGRIATLDRDQSQLAALVAKTLAIATKSHLAAVGLIYDDEIIFEPEHHLIDGVAAEQQLRAPIDCLPLDWFRATDVPAMDPLPPALADLTPYAEPATLLVPLTLHSDVLGVLAFQPQAQHAVDERLERVIQSAAAQLATGLSNARLYSDLQRQHESLVRSEHTKEQLTQMIVHDLKNPLTAILNYLELLRRDTLNPLQGEMVHGARRSAMMMLGLVSDLLDSARLQDGHLELRLETLAVDNFLCESIADLLPWAEQESKSVTTQVNGKAWTVTIDPQLIQRVLINLVSNAIKHTPLGARIIVGAERREGATVLWVQDNGPGIPPALLPHLFERFSTGSGPSLGQRSTGLGLYFCKLAVEAHGGEITVKSAAKTGTRFSVTLPHQPVTG